ITVEALESLLVKSSKLLSQDPFHLHQLSKIHRDSVAKVATEVAHCHARFMHLETTITRRRADVLAERAQLQTLLESLDVNDERQKQKLVYLRNRVDRMLNSMERQIDKQQDYLRTCSLFELEDTLDDLQMSLDHENKTIDAKKTTVSQSTESVASSIAPSNSYHSCQSTSESKIKESKEKSVERVINEAVLSTWTVSRSLTHISDHSSTPIDIKEGAKNLLGKIERMATLLSSSFSIEATDTTQYTNAISDATSLESCLYRDSTIEL
ncbi:hypothetical protein PFISCL1PPCAC_22399, partial [Pristionchus fissidentatus]